MSRPGSNPRNPRWAARAAVSLAGCLIWTLSVASTASAVTESPDPIGQKLQQGLAGIAFGFLEVPGTIVEQAEANGPWVGFALGLTQGVGRFVTRELVGVYQVITAPFPLPAATQQPEFPWGYFERDTVVAEGSSFEAEQRELGWIRGIEVEQRSGALVVTFPGALQFGPGSDRIDPAAETRLIGLAETLLRLPQLQVELQGHSDATGSAARNQQLSELRAESVEKFLLTQGMSRDRIHTVGFGSSQPLAGQGISPEDAANRRVEVVLTQSVAAGP